VEHNNNEKLPVAGCTLLALGAAEPTLPADLAARPYTKAPPSAPTPIYNWTGFYIGGHIGGAFAATTA
jgi:outer membrane immunogenic protein